MQLEQLQQRAKAKQKKTEAVAAVGRLKNHEGYSAAVRQLDELSTELKSHVEQLEQIKARSVREVKEAQHYIRAEARVWDHSSDDIAIIARMRIRTGNLPEDLHDPCDFADHYRDPDARDVILRFDFHRRAIEVLKFAVDIQRKTVTAQKRQAIMDICAALQPKYHPIARRVAESLLELGSALEEERAFSRQLVAEDAEIAQGLKPRPFFLVGILSSPDLELWINEAIESGLIDPTDPRASALGAASKATA